MPKKKAKLPLSKTHPKLAKEADGWDPRTISAGSGVKKNWRCSKRHVFYAVFWELKDAKHFCEKCEN